MQNLASRWGRVISLGETTTDDYTFGVPFFGDPRYFRNGEYLWQFRANVLLVVNVDSPEMKRFAEELRPHGWRVHAAGLTGRVSCPELVFDALRSLATRYVTPHRRRHRLA